jgi:hypothetical protein
LRLRHDTILFFMNFPQLWRQKHLILVRKNLKVYILLSIALDSRDSLPRGVVYGVRRLKIPSQHRNGALSSGFILFRFVIMC